MNIHLFVDDYSYKKGDFWMKPTVLGSFSVDKFRVAIQRELAAGT